MKRINLAPEPIIESYKDGATLFHLAKINKVDRCVIERILKSNGIKMRTIREAQLLRYTRTTFDERQAITQAANVKIRGSIKTERQLINRAIGVELACHLSKPEQDFFNAFSKFIDIKPLKQVFKYNIDLAIEDSKIAIEIHNSFHVTQKHSYQDAKKLNYLSNNGWILIYLYPKDLFGINFYSTLALAKVRGSNPRITNEELMIRCRLDSIASN